MKEMITVGSTLIFYIALAIIAGINSNKFRASYKADFKKIAEDNGWISDAKLIKCKTRYQKFNDYETAYDKCIYEYEVKGKKYRFTRNYEESKHPTSIKVWFQESHPRKRVIDGDDVVSKFIWVVYLLPLVYGVFIYNLLGLYGF